MSSDAVDELLRLNAELEQAKQDITRHCARADAAEATLRSQKASKTCACALVVSPARCALWAFVGATVALSAREQFASCRTSTGGAVKVDPHVSVRQPTTFAKRENRRQLRPRMGNAAGHTRERVNFTCPAENKHCDEYEQLHMDEWLFECSSPLFCGMRLGMRATMQLEPLFDELTPTAVHIAPLDSGARLHVPMYKLTGHMRNVSHANWAHILATAEKGNTSAAAVPLYPSWPERKEVSKMSWSLIGTPEARTFAHCSANVHWYCVQTAPGYADSHRNTLALYKARPNDVFSRSDVRLVLDMGGGSGGFAEAVHDLYGDRIVTVVGQAWTTMLDGSYGRIAPTAQMASARGFVVVALDVYGYLPFTENSFDVIHAAWVFNAGSIPRLSLYEYWRVLRPGGFLVFRNAMGFTGVVESVKHFVKTEGWTIHDGPFSTNNGAVIVARVPV